MVVIPPHRLDPNASPWGNKVTELLKQGLNDIERFQANTVTINQAIASTSNAAVNNSVALIETTDDLKNQARVPEAPASILVTTASHWSDSGEAVSTVDVSWEEVTVDISNQDIVIKGYEVWWRDADPDYDDAVPVIPTDPDVEPDPLIEPPFTLLRAVDKNELIGAQFTLGRDIVLKARAISQFSIPGLFSDNFRITTDDNPPVMVAPSLPVVTSELAVINVAWDGLMGDGSQPPVQFSGVFAQISDTETGTYVSAGQNLLVNGTSVISDVIKGNTYWVRLAGIDRLGRVTATSASVSVVVIGVQVDNFDEDVTEYIQSVGGGNHITYSVDPAPDPPVGTEKDGDIWWQRDGGAIIGQWGFEAGVWVAQTLSHQVISSVDLGTATVGELDGIFIKAGTIKTVQLDAEAVTTDKIKAGAVDTAQLTSTAINGMTITGAQIQTDAAANTGIKFTTAGLLGYDGSGNQIFRLNAVTGAIMSSSSIGNTVTIDSGRIQSTFYTGDKQTVLMDTGRLRFFPTDDVAAATTAEYAFDGIILNLADNGGSHGLANDSGQLLIRGGTVNNNAFMTLGSTASGGSFAVQTAGTGSNSNITFDSTNANASFIAGPANKDQAAVAGTNVLVTINTSTAKLGRHSGALPTQYIPALDSAQITTGRLGPVNIIGSANLNTIVDTGWYCGNNLVGAPTTTAGYYWVEVQALNAANVLQTATLRTGGINTVVSYQRMNLGGSWTAWKQLGLPDDTGWTQPTLSNGWVNTASMPLQYRKIGGIVYLRGRATGGSTGTAFVLPAGYRIDYPDQKFPVQTGSVSGSFATVTITSAGEVQLVTGTAPYLYAINFPAEA